MATTNGGRGRLGVGIVIAAVFVLLAASTAVATFYTEVLWFTDLGHVNVLWTTLVSEWVVGLVFGAVFFAALFFAALNQPVDHTFRVIAAHFASLD